MDTPKFSLGQCVITSAAHDSLCLDDVQIALNRHVHGDWGDLDPHDIEQNEIGLAQGRRLFSVYTDRGGVKYYIITEHDRSVTTVLLPEDY